MIYFFPHQKNICFVLVLLRLFMVKQKGAKQYPPILHRWILGFWCFGPYFLDLKLTRSNGIGFWVQVSNGLFYRAFGLWGQTIDLPGPMLSWHGPMKSPFAFFSRPSLSLCNTCTTHFVIKKLQWSEKRPIWILSWFGLKDKR